MAVTSTTCAAEREGPQGHVDPAGALRSIDALRAWWARRPAWTEAAWWGLDLRPEVRRLLRLPAGPELAAAVAEVPRDRECTRPHSDDQLLDLPVPGHASGWPCACQVVTAAAWEACAAWVAAGSARSLVAAAGPEPVRVDVAGGHHQLHDPAREELAHALRWTPLSAGNRIAAARALTTHPALLDLVAGAMISPWVARLITDQLTGLTDEQAARVVAGVVAKVRDRLDSGRRPFNSAEVNRLARAARLRLCPEAERERRVRAFRHRRVSIHGQPDGMATLVADLAEMDAHRIHRRLSSIASGIAADASAGGEPETRSRDQIRADVLTDLLLHGVGSTCQGAMQAPVAPVGPAVDGPSPGGASDPQAVPGMPRPQKEPATPEGAAPPATPQPSDDGTRRAAPVPTRGPEVQVIVTLETLVGLSQDPAEVPGLGPIAAELARELAADGRWRAWVADAAGAISATGSAGYVPSAAVARMVRAREPHCRFPGCRQPATRCDLDHAIPYPRGATEPDNLGPLCRRHHVLKTHGGWHLTPARGAPDGDEAAHPEHPVAHSGWFWRTPAGFHITDEPSRRAP